MGSFPETYIGLMSLKKSGNVGKDLSKSCFILLSFHFP